MSVRQILLATVASTLLAPAVTLRAQRGGEVPLPQPVSALGAVPVDLGPDQQFTGIPWTGEAGITETVSEIMARDAAEPRTAARPLRLAPLGVRTDPKREDPYAARLSQWPVSEPIEIAEPETAPRTPQTVGTNWVGTHASESGAVPPDSIGAVGPTQVLVLSNGRVKVYDKAGTLGGLNVSDNTFFASVRGSSSVSDPHVRYDRASGRWFITEINVSSTSNRILIAVSSGSTITSTSSFTFFQFQHDLVGTTPNVDTGHFADYDTLGVDAKALYIGVNEFTSSTGSFQNTTGYVVNKANLIAGTLTVTAFRGLATGSGAGPYTPQGVDNDDPDATEGYFIGVDNQSFSKLTIRRVSNPGGTPSISGNIFVTVSSTYYPLSQVQQGSTKKLDAIDDRLFAAAITKNQITGVSSLWTAHNLRMNSSGVSSSSGDRNGIRWYQLDSMTTTPTLTQSGTLVDSAASNPKGYWMGSVAASGQGHMALIASFAGAANYAGVAAAGRLSDDTTGATQSPSVVVNGANAYVDWTGYSTQRWGDYSQVVVDPTDDQTMWAFAEYAYSTSTTDAWGVRAVKLVAPPPATPATASPSSVDAGVASTDITLTGTSSSGSGFFDPGSGFTSRIAAEIGGGVTVNSVTFVSATKLTLNISTVGASAGARDITITNPDGQQKTGTSLLTIGSTSAFTDDPLTADVTLIKAVHITQLRSRIDTQRTRFGLAAFSWTDPTLSVGSTGIKAVHVAELRTALQAAYSSGGFTPPSFIDPSLTAGSSAIKAIHIKELRDAVVTLEGK